MTKARDLANAATALGAVTATELSYLDGVTSAIQTQFSNVQTQFTNAETQLNTTAQELAIADAMDSL
jgi:hypothetical protein